MKKIKIAAIGCGARTQIYTELASRMPKYYEVVAAADPKIQRVKKIAAISGNPSFRCFNSADAILAEDKLADLMIIGTQDSYHFQPCKKAMEKGYDILLEKPIANSLEEIIELEKLAVKLKRKVAVCYVLRYATFYRKIKEILESGQLGQIITINANEGVHPWHMAHSFVRGHWAVVEKSSPMIVAKCCHDTDILSWLTDQKCKSISSFGRLTYFTRKNMPKNVPKRCTDGCPIENSCMYNAKLYANKYKSPWLGQVFDGFDGASTQEIMEWLKISDWGRCVYQCDNNAVDHQVLAMDFEGGATATFTVTAFEDGRHIEVYGTKGILKAGSSNKKVFGADITVIEHHSGGILKYDIPQSEEDYGSHMGGDMCLMDSLYDQLVKPNHMHSSLSSSVHSHVMAFAAEESRITGKTINMGDFYDKYAK